MSTTEILKSYLEVVHGTIKSNEWVSRCFCGDLLQAGQWISRMTANGVNLPCKNSFPHEIA
jgi:hypothetical protein